MDHPRPPARQDSPSRHPPAVLLTGPPGVGKTTLIRRSLSRLGEDAGGFYTRELRADGRRTGFELVTLAGETALLATAGSEARFRREARLGRYRVNLDALDEAGVPALLAAWRAGILVVVDEIGPMELFSEHFRELIFQMLDADIAILGTVYGRRHPVADLVKAHPRVRVWTVTRGNRDDLVARIVETVTPYIVGR